MLRVFDNINKSDNCYVCGTNKDGKVTLIPVMNTQEGNIAEAKQVHLDCLDLWIDGDSKAIIHYKGEE